MAEQENYAFPMISKRSWWILRDKFKASLPTTVTPNYVKSLLTLDSDASAVSNVLTPMKRLGLLDEDNKPTELANAWRIDNSYKDACEEMIKRVYPTELLDLFPDSNVDAKTAKQWFMGNGVGQAAADKMTRLFMLLKKGEVSEKRVGKESSSAKPQTRKTKSSKPLSSETGANLVEIETSLSKTAHPSLHIDLQIHISPDSTPEQIDAIFASMAKHLYKAGN